MRGYKLKKKITKTHKTCLINNKTTKKKYKLITKHFIKINGERGNQKKNKSFSQKNKTH